MEWMLMPLRRYAEFSGRSRRMEFWMWQVFKVLLYVVLTVLMMLVGGAGMLMAGSGGNPGAGVAAMGVGAVVLYGIMVLLGLAFIIPDIAVQVRRLHDTDRSGWWILAPLGGYVVALVGLATGSRALSAIGMIVAVVFAIVLLVFYFLDGTVGPNRFGADPKGRASAEVFA